jgi:hypothetical protein
MILRWNSSWKYLALALLLAALGGAGTAAMAQAIYGSIYGQITDPSGAAIPNATVTVTDEAKGTSVQATANGSGEYQVLHLIPDVYDVEVSATGFGKAQSKSIRVSADTGSKIDLKLTVGTATQNITVTTEAPQLEADRADVSAVFDEKTVATLPIAGRNFADLELLIPGSQVMGWSQNSAEDAQGSPTVQIAGQSFSGVGYILDGAANQDPILGQIVINPPLDAVTEAKITTDDYDAEFGQSVAGIVSSQTKSGTNGFHGDLFDYRRSDAQQARNPFTQNTPDVLTHRLLPPSLYSQFGGSIGGPILKNKLFFFGDYQAVRQKIGASARETVPTALMHQSCLSGNGCDFSEYLTARGAAQGQLYNPGVIDPVTGPQPFANNFIPQKYLSAPALALLKLIPLPNGAGTVNNYTNGGNGVVNQNQFDTRVDDQLNETMHAFARYSYFDNLVTAGTVFGAAGGSGFSSPTNSFGGSANGRNQSAVAGMDIAVHPTLLTDFRLGYLRYHVQTHKYDGTDDLATKVGIPGLNLGDLFTSGAPAFYLSDGLSNFGSGLGVDASNSPLLETEDQYQLVNNWTKILGNHSFRFGVDLRYGRNLRVPSDQNRAGELHFDSSDTENPKLATPGGSGLATFMLGDVTYFDRYVSTSTNAKESQKRVFSYAQDTWRVTPTLTLNLGLRQEIYFPETVNGTGQGGFADLNTGQIRVAGYGPFNTAMNVKKDFNTVAPRIGIAYQVNPKTVVRTGYGRSFDIGVFGSIFGHVVTQNLPVLAAQNITNSGPNTAAFNLANGPPAFAFPSIPTSGLISIPNGDNVKVRMDPERFPTVDSWNLSIQRELSNSSSITLAYVGNKGTHTFAGDGQNTNPNEPAACLPASESSTSQALCWNSAPANSSQTNNTALLRPYYAKYGWTQDITFMHDGHDTHYNALHVTLGKRISHGLEFTGVYSWQRAFNYGSDYAEIDRKVNYGRFDELREQQFTFYGNYDLPFGRHRQFLSGIPAWEDYVIGGWAMSTSLSWSSGLPFTLNYGECGTDIPAGPCRPNKGSGSLALHLTSFDPNTHTRTYFSPGPQFGTNGSASGAFTRPAIDQFGNIARNGMFGPSFFNDDASFFKTIPIWELIRLQFRMDAFNLFNHINPGNPGNTCIDCTVGSGAGVITGTALGTTPRQLEFSATVSF